MKKAYMHAIEGVIASMLVLLYLSTLVSAPESTDWRETALTQRAGDVLETLTQTGVMEQALINDDPGVIAAVTDAIGAEMDYSMYIQGLPQRTLDIGILMNGSDITRTGTAAGATGDGLPATEDSHRSGTIMGVDFVLADSFDDNITQYNHVSFDFDGNDSYSDEEGRLDEGPYEQGDTVTWCPGGDCTRQRYQIGHINETITLYNMTEYRRLNQSLSQIQVNRFDIEAALGPAEIRSQLSVPETGFTDTSDGFEASIDVDGATIDLRVTPDGDAVYIDEGSGFHGPYEEGNEVQILGEFYSLNQLLPFEAAPENLLPQDVIIHQGDDPSVLDTYRQPLQDYLAGGGTILQMTDFSGYDEDTFEGSFHDQIGFDWLDYPVIDDNPGYNTLVDGDAGTPADTVSSYFGGLTMDVPEQRFIERPQPNPVRAWANATIRGQQYTINTSLLSGLATISRPGFETTVSPGDRVVLEGNLFSVQDTYPLALEPGDRYRFTNRHHGNVAGGTPVMIAPEWDWNNTAASINISGLDDSASFAGWPPTDCASDNDHKGRIFNLDGGTYGIATTNFRPCDRQYEYVTFDFTGDGDVDDNATATGDGFGPEGIFQEGEQIGIDGKRYRIEIGSDGTWVYLERVAPEQVGTGLWMEDAYSGDGDVFLTGTSGPGIDDQAFLRTVMVRAAMDRYLFSQPKTIGSPSVGLGYASDIEGDVYAPYHIESVWWFQ